MGMMYVASFQGVSVSAVQDLFEITAPADAVVVIHRCEITDEDSETSEQNVIVMNRGSSATTSGSGGAAVTPAPLDQGYAAAGSSVERNNTTPMSGGTITQRGSWGFNWLNGFLFVPTPEERPVVSPSERHTFKLLSAPGSARNVSGVLVFEEIGG